MLDHTRRGSFRLIGSSVSRWRSSRWLCLPTCVHPRTWCSGTNPARALLAALFPGGHSPNSFSATHSFALAESTLSIGGIALRERPSTYFLILALALVFPLVGGLLSLGLFVVAEMVWVEKQKWLTSVLGGMVAVGIVWGIFVLLLGVPLPTGPLGSDLKEADKFLWKYSKAWLARSTLPRCCSS